MCSSHASSKKILNATETITESYNHSRCRVVELIRGYIYKANFTTKGSKNIEEEGPETLEELEHQGICYKIVYPSNFKTWAPKVSLLWLPKRDLSKLNNRHDKVEWREGVCKALPYTEN